MGTLCIWGLDGEYSYREEAVEALTCSCYPGEGMQAPPGSNLTLRENSKLSGLDDCLLAISHHQFLVDFVVVLGYRARR
jgi:hypothetical protein